MKQFVYLVAAAITAFLLFKFGPFPQLINISLAGLVGLVGFAFAFVPIQERSLDRWILAFIKSITSPTQYTWKKEEVLPDILAKPSVIRIEVRHPAQTTAHQDAKAKLDRYLASIPQSAHESLNTHEKRYVESTLALFESPTLVINVSQGPHPQTAQSVVVAAIPVPISQPPTEAKPDLPEEKIVTEKPLSTSSPVTLSSSQIPQKQSEDFEKLKGQLSRLSAEREFLAKELESLQGELSKSQKSDVVKPQMDESAKIVPTVKTITQKSTSSEIGMPKLPQYPNIITGVIKDPQKKLLPNIIITIKDTTALPLRALKTNKLGQFETATPLQNGTYHLEIEDPLKRFTFDIAEITLNGTIFYPIEIIAKGEKEILREKLAKEIFGSGGTI